MVHPLSLLLDQAAHGRFPPADGAVRVLPPLPDGLDALVAFTGTFVLAGAVSQAEIDARAPKGEFGIPMSAPFVAWLAQRLDAKAATNDAVLVAISGADAPGDLVDIGELVELPDSDHPRVQRAVRYRSDTRIYSTVNGEGVVVLGRGITRRWEIGFEVADGAQRAGIGRALAAAAVRLLPAGTPVWAQVAPGNAASLRAVLGAGFRPVGAEILFVREHG